MMKLNKQKLLLCLMLLVCMFFASCTLKPNKTQQPLTLQLSAEPSTLNPLLYTDAASSQVVGLVFSGLLKVSTNMQLIPDLAESYQVNKDQTIYTFKLRDNLFFHDGHPLSSKDVKFTFDLLLDSKTNTVRRSNYIINGKKVIFKQLDDRHIQAILPQPFAPFLYHMTMGILPKHLLENVDINTAAFNRQPIGSGPFKFEQWLSAQFVQLKRHERYYADTPKLKEIVLKIIPDNNTALVSLEKGEIDTATLLGKDYQRYQNHPDFNIYRYDDLLYTYLGFNLKNSHFSQLKVRQAVAYAIDKQAIVKGVLKGFGSPAELPASPVSWAYPDIKTPFYHYDPQKSMSLLLECGYQKNQQGYFEKDQKELSFTLITNKGNKDREKVAQLLQQFLKNVGIKMDIRLLEWSSFIKIVNDPSQNKKFDAVILGWSLGLDPDSYNIWHSSQFPKGFNFIAYNNKQVDQLLVQGRLQNNKQVRKEIYQKIYRIIGAEIPYIFLYYPETLTGIQDRVKGLSSASPVGLFNPIENVFITP